MQLFIKKSILFVFIFFNGAVITAQNASLSIQGVLRDEITREAKPNGTYTLNFKLFPALTGGVEVYNADYSVQLVNGVYNVVLGEGSGTQLLDNVPFTEDYWVEISVKSEPNNPSVNEVISPRVKLTSAPFALALRGNSNVFPSTGGVGIGTLAPDAANKLQVEGNTKVNGTLGIGVTPETDIEFQVNGDEKISGTSTLNNVSLSNLNVSGSLTTSNASGNLETPNINSSGTVSAINVKTDTIQVKGNPLFTFKRFTINSPTDQLIATEYSFTDWHAAVVGFDYGYGDLSENGDQVLFKALMTNVNGVWNLRMRSTASLKVTNILIDVMFVRSEVVSRTGF